MKTDIKTAPPKSVKQRGWQQRRGHQVERARIDARALLCALLLSACGAEGPLGIEGSTYQDDSSGKSADRALQSAEVGTTGEALQAGASNVLQDLNVPLARSYSRDLRPPTNAPVTIRVDQPQAGADPMVAVIRWRNSVAWDVGVTPDYHSQAPFDVVAFNDDISDLDTSAQTTFVPDGRSQYTLFVMPFDQGSAKATTGRLTISGCSGCDFQATIPVHGYVLHGASGNAFDINTVDGSTEGNDPWLFALSLFPTKEDPIQFKGVGTSNDDGRPGAPNLMPSLYSNSTLKGRHWDLVFATSWGATVPGRMAHLMIGNEPAVIGLPARPPNTTCIAPTQTSEIKTTIAETGCFDPVTREPAGGLIPYDVAHPFWSDGVHKERFLYLPTNASINIDDAGKWRLPTGGMMIKNFYYNQFLFETRFVVQLASGQLAYTYDWREGGAAGAKRVDNLPASSVPVLSLTGDPHLGSRDWNFPTNGQCLQCHGRNGVNDYFLGLNAQQFNTEVEYETSGLHADQIRTLASIGVLTGPGLGKLIGPNLTKMPTPGYEARPDVPAGANPSWEQARAFVDVNCAYCHNAASGLSWLANSTVGFDDMNVCNVPSTRELLDKLEPQRATESFMSIRAHSRAAREMMPPLATKLVDNAGVALLDGWINGMTTSCAAPPVSIRLATTPLCLKADVRAVDPVTNLPAVSRKLDVVACSNTNTAQGFILTDDGAGVTIRPTLADPKADPALGDCLLIADNATARRTCNAKAEWYRDYLPGGAFQLVNTPTNRCLTKFGSGTRLETCRGTDTQIWKTVNRP